MVNAVLLGGSPEAPACLESLIRKTCPDINISCKASSMADVYNYLRESRPDVMFVDIDQINGNDIDLIDNFIEDDFEIIFVTRTTDDVLKTLKYGATGYILKPVKRADLLNVVNHAMRKIRKKEEQNRNKDLLERLVRQNGNNEIIGIPTLEGFEFIHVDDIIRCEGLQKCTRIITNEKSDMISSYNLGEFRKILEPHGFFSPHKSHLVNLKYIKKYNREGSIIMCDGSYAPVSKRKKKDFLDQFTHF